MSDEDRYGWMVVGALYALGCDPASFVQEQIVRETRDGVRARAAVEAAKAAPAGRRVFAVFDALDPKKTT
jgi:hypothetical protein